jgi:hypothetical protein
MFGANLSLEHALLQLGHFPSVAIHRRIHIEQKVCEQDVITGFVRNSLHTSQRKAASSGSNWGSEVDNQSVESGRSKVESMKVFVVEKGLLVPGDDRCVKSRRTRPQVQRRPEVTCRLCRARFVSIKGSPSRLDAYHTMYFTKRFSKN